jgi:hypothetical protein
MGVQRETRAFGDPWQPALQLALRNSGDTLGMLSVTFSLSPQRKRDREENNMFMVKERGLFESLNNSLVPHLFKPFVYIWHL